MTRSSKIFALGRLALILSAGAGLSAQEINGQITGLVTSGGQPVAGATVTITASQLISPRSIQTNAKGEYRAPLLPPGDYTITVVKEGFLTSSVKGARLGAGAQLSLPFSLKTAEVASTTVVIVGDQGTVDKADPKQSTNFSYEQINALPTSGDRSFTGALDLAPGAAFNSGGGVSIRGGKTQTAQFTVNGTNITDDYEGRNTGVYLIDDAVEDIQVVQSPLHARYGRTGSGLINVVTKSGSNEFSGSLRLYQTRQDWSALRPHELDSSATSDSYSTRNREYFLAGPIWKDHVWFALSGYRVPPVSSQNTVLQGETPGGWFYGSGTGDGPSTAPSNTGAAPAVDPSFNDAVALFPFDYNKSYQETDTDKLDQAKLTVAITPNHTVDATYSKHDLTLQNHNPYGVPLVSTIQSNSYAQTDEEKLWNIGYRGTLSNNLFLEARYSHKDSSADFPRPPYEHIRLYEQSNEGVQFPYGFNVSPTTDKRNSRSANANLKWFADTGTGSHEVDFGYDYYESVRQTSDTTGWNYQRFYVYGATGDAATLATYGVTTPDPYGNKVGFLAVNWTAGMVASGVQSATAGFGLAPTNRRYFGRDGLTSNRNDGIYANDVWSVNNHWVVMLGARMDRVKVTDTDGSVLLKTNEPISPRFSLKYDVFGDSAHVLSFSAAKFVEDISAGYTDAFIKKSGGKYVDYGWSANAVNPGAAGAAQWVSYTQITNPANYTTPYNYGNTAATNLIGNITNPYVMEYTLGYRRSRANGSYFSATYVHRDWKNDFATIQDFGAPYFVTVTDPSGSGLPSRLQEGALFQNSDTLKRTYNGVELSFKEVVNEIWTFAGEYTWSRLVGNNNGGDNGSQGFRDDSATGSAPTYFRSWLLAQGYSEQQFAATGPLLSDQTHKLRVYLVRTDKMGIGKISQSLLFRFDSGNNFSITQTGPTFLPPRSATVPSLPRTFTYYSTGRGAFHQNDTYQFDYKLDWYVPVYKTLGLMGYVQVDNVFNHQLQATYVNGTRVSTYTAPIRVSSTNPYSGFGTDGGNASSWIGARSFAASIGIKF